MVLACIAHWYTSLIFFVPFGGIAGAVWFAGWKEKRSNGADDGDDAGLAELSGQAHASGA
jgi:hypothetical protein